MNLHSVDFNVNLLACVLGVEHDLRECVAEVEGHSRFLLLLAGGYGVDKVFLSFHISGNFVVVERCSSSFAGLPSVNALAAEVCVEVNGLVLVLGPVAGRALACPYVAFLYELIILDVVLSSTYGRYLELGEVGRRVNCGCTCRSVCHGREADFVTVVINVDDVIL